MADADGHLGANPMKRRPLRRLLNAPTPVPPRPRRSTFIQLESMTRDEDISLMDTKNTPQVDIQGLITRVRTRQLNLQVISFLRNY
jgi:hypothetical protein